MKNLIFLLLLPLLCCAQFDKNISVISTERYTILYRGISNPIKIAVPGAVSFTASARGLTKKDSIGNYDFNVTSISGDTVSIKIVAKMPDNSIIKDIKTFEVRDLKMPIVLINGTNGCKGVVQMTKKELQNGLLSASINDPAIDSFLIIKSFEMYFPKKPGIVIEGDTINEKAFKFIEKLKPGDKVYITNINLHFIGESMRSKGPSPIIIKIVKER